MSEGVEINTDANGNKEWWINGKPLTELEFENLKQHKSLSKKIQVPDNTKSPKVKI